MATQRFADEMTSPARMQAVLDPVAEAIFYSIFEEPLPPVGHIERDIYREAAEAGLRAGVEYFRAIRGEPA